jgi:hypothetical protein
VAVAVAVTITASAAPTSDEEVTLKATIAVELSLDTASIKNFVVSYYYWTTSRRLLGLRASPALSSLRRRVRSVPHGLRRLTTTYVWYVTFDIVVSLSALNDDSVTSAAALKSMVSKALDSGLESALADAGMDVSVESVSTTAEDDTYTEDDDKDGGPSDLGPIIIASVGGVLLLGALAGVAWAITRRRASAGATISIQQPQGTPPEGQRIQETELTAQRQRSKKKNRRKDRSTEVPTAVPIVVATMIDET